MDDPIGRALEARVKQLIRAERAKLAERLQSGGHIEPEDIRLLEPHEWAVLTMGEVLGPVLVSIESHVKSIDDSLRVLAGRPPARASEESADG